MSERLGPERSVRLLRAKAGELEQMVLDAANASTGGAPLRPVDAVRADVALIATLLADHIEACHADG